MRIAITADLHLTTRQKHPERYHALENIFQQMLDEDINTIFIAGDLFDESSRNYAEFDNFCSGKAYTEFEIIVIPGNHDSSLEQSEFTSGNLKIYSQPTLRDFERLAVLFLPFKAGKTMGDYVSRFAGDLAENNWLLVGHGDWAAGMSEPNPFEPGVYMPLTRSDLETFKPAKVILGHIHKPMQHGGVHYVGSPCGLDIRETGPRRFLILNTESAKVEPRKVDTEKIFFNESFIIHPVDDESDYIRKQIAARIKSWQLQPEDLARVQIKVSVFGYSANKRKLMETIKECFRKFSFYKNWPPDLSGVSTADDINRAEVANRVFRWIKQYDWHESNDQPTKKDIFYEALKVIYED
ncbi:MAG: exonuclease SbcCD subunit D [bacterium]